MRRDEEFNDAVRRVEDIMAAAVAALIETVLSADHRQLLGSGIVGLAEVTSRHWASSTVAEQLDGDQRAAEAQPLAGKVSELAWAGLRGLHREPSDR
ncbi:MAG TPA: hypothetical protein VHT75_15560 [Acidimicrobiales bacterium]|jgi:hypothetical protein|nr:hypothetical protein [Acidimicrobiales bacterium]